MKSGEAASRARVSGNGFRKDKAIIAAANGIIAGKLLSKAGLDVFPAGAGRQGGDRLVDQSER
jgi:hypothetical protein